MIDVRREYLNRGFSRRGFAEHVGVPWSSIRRLEKRQGIRPERAKKVADELGCQVTDLLPVGDESVVA